MKNKSIYQNMNSSEKEVSRFLKNLRIRWLYEQPLYVYDDKDRPRVWTPDFYLPDLGVYIEVCGSKDIDYEYREAVYSKNDTPIIFIHFYKHDKWKYYFIKRLKEIFESRENMVKGINFRYKKL